METAKNTIVQEGMQAPDFRLESDLASAVSPRDYLGSALILYFYPKDDTPGCTAQACGFRDSLQDFEKLNAKVLGISKDTLKKHAGFRAKYDLNFPLLADTDGAVCDLYGTWVEKSMYGKKYMGIDRATFLIDAKGIVRHIWRKVKVPGHIEDVREALAAL